MQKCIQTILFSNTKKKILFFFFTEATTKSSIVPDIPQGEKMSLFALSMT